MKLRHGTVAEFSAYTVGKKIACFGAYVMPLSLCNEFDEYGFEDRIAYFIDNDKKKHGKLFDLNGRMKEIISVDQFVNRFTSDTVLIIASDYFAAIIEQLDAYKELDELECYIYPFMKYDIDHSEIIPMRHTKEPLIPKVIHYCWFGGNPMSELMKQCIDSWKSIVLTMNWYVGMRVIMMFQKISL